MGYLLGCWIDRTVDWTEKMYEVLVDDDDDTEENVNNPTNVGGWSKTKGETKSHVSYTSLVSGLVSFNKPKFSLVLSTLNSSFLLMRLDMSQCFDWQLMNVNVLWLVTTCWHIALRLSCWTSLWTHHHPTQLSRSCNSSEGAVVWHMTCRQATTVHNSIGSIGSNGHQPDAVNKHCLDIIYSGLLYGSGATLLQCCGMPPKPLIAGNHMTIYVSPCYIEVQIVRIIIRHVM